MSLEDKSSAKSSVVEKIKQWLTDEELAFTPKDNAYSDFYIEVKIGSSMITVILSKNRPDTILICTRSFFSQLDQRAFATLNKTDKQTFIQALRFSLLEQKVGFVINPTIDKIEDIYMEKKIYFDGLTKDRFFETVGSLVFAIELVSLIYEKYLHSKANASAGYRYFIF